MPLLGDVALGDDEVQRLAGLVTGRGLRDFGDDHATVLVEVALHVAHLSDLVLQEAVVRRLGDADVVGVGEGFGVEADEFGARASHHRAEGVVRRDDAVLEVGEDHRRHVVLEGQPEVLFGLDARLFGGALGTVVADRSDGPVLRRRS